MLGFSNMLAKLPRKPTPTIAVIFDAAGTSFRNRLYDQYKANRGAPPDDLVPQFKLVRGRPTLAYAASRWRILRPTI